MMILGTVSGELPTQLSFFRVDRSVGLGMNWEFGLQAAANQHLCRTEPIGSWCVPEMSKPVKEIIIEPALALHQKFLDRFYCRLSVTI